ncbi:hypothetical protein [Chengkuizengella marina]|uniref:Uncharacterized protein n=1 Tax=Chengkuizengella marina TaxID=2507566 RepID=A0A6N9Q1Z9_9BACL|nr:hypothetical protein [Chengkuizengella marina]NBI28430.1 hypothetical protein [Chengkuizengella marina]
MAISFVLAANIDAVEFAENTVEYSEEVHNFLIKNKQMFEGNVEIDILIGLDPYSDTCISQEEIPIVKEAAQIIQHTLESLSDKNGIIKELLDFAQSIIEFCDEAIQKKKCLIAIGD